MVHMNVKVPSPLVVHAYSVLVPISDNVDGSEKTTFEL